MAIKNIALLFSGVFVLSGCLQTRAELRRPPDAREQAQLQKTVQVDNRIEDINNDFRQLYGRVETLENHQRNQSNNENLRALEARIAGLETKMNLLEASVADLNMKAKKQEAAEKAAPKLDGIALANKYFDDRKWEDAITAYEDYRKSAGRGTGYAQATYKIGLCFQNLGLKDEAKAFYKEVVDKYPSSKEASLAKSKLKKI